MENYSEPGASPDFPGYACFGHHTKGSLKNKLPFFRAAIFVEIKASRLAG
jgi:hypothetical protein